MRIIFRIHCAFATSGAMSEAPGHRRPPPPRASRCTCGGRLLDHGWHHQDEPMDDVQLRDIHSSNCVNSASIRAFVTEKAA